ncbi:(2Fe-2S)-binding protein [Rhodomicrobium sp. Az07]|uniref:(2Fe-2S)-binding protein n=1 Tax=Rhodomicrobium sp. Az07 TaxID=2839034 RepID=UPI002036A04A|nr:(2Fe-2S)-binding protein [Rhodomicrobium sp. Az07]
MSSPNPPRTPCQVHRHFGCTAKCGRCTRSLRDAMDEGRAEQPMEQLQVAKVA